VEQSGAHVALAVHPQGPHLVLYEYPFNESIRTMLRLEHLFDRLGQLIARETPSITTTRWRRCSRSWTSPRAPT
jgi:hypothetical protein